MTSRAIAILFSFLFITPSAFSAEQRPAIQILVDATEAPRKIFHAKLVIPVSPGPLTLWYPKWLPGYHGPDGPIVDLTGLKISAGGNSIPWERDPVNMFAIHLNVPSNASSIEVELDYVSPATYKVGSSNASATDQLTILNWNTVLLYPDGFHSDNITFEPSIRLPNNWKYGTSLRLTSASEDVIRFKPVSLTTLVDSPLIAGAHFKSILLTPSNVPPVYLDIVADSESALKVSPEIEANYKRLVAETMTLFGAHHFETYHFLLTLSDYVAHFGLEHHESSDNRVPEDTLIDSAVFKINADLLPHEIVHSWNAKYRRPDGLATSNYDVPMKSDLLWVYEGLTNYLGSVLAARSGLWTQKDYKEQLAVKASTLDYTPGRKWRPLVDTAVSAQILYESSSAWSNWRRGVDFYPEGELIWLEADVLIRQSTNGKLSLDDFCKKFFGPPNTPPMVKTYTAKDVFASLHEIAPYDWQKFFEDRVYAVTPHPPLNGIQNGGWRLVYKEDRSSFQVDLEESDDEDEIADLSESIGMKVSEDGSIIDVVQGSPTAFSGIGPGMKLIAVNSRRYSPDVLRAALRSAKEQKTNIDLLVENTEIYRTYSVQYKEGERYPHLERDDSKPDVLQKILQPRTKQ